MKTVPADWVAEHADSGSVCFIFLNPLKDEEAATIQSNQEADYHWIGSFLPWSSAVNRNHPAACGQKVIGWRVE